MIKTALTALAGSVCLSTLGAWAQVDPYPTEAQLRFEVWNGFSWSNINFGGLSGSRIEFRAVVSYTGPRTDLFGLGEILYQPTLSDAIVEGIPLSRDDFASWRTTTLTTPEGQDPSNLGTYGRVTYGSTAMNTANQNILTNFRHQFGNNGAPPGQYLRAAGSFVSQWPAASLPTAPGADAINRIQRGVASGQLSQALDPTRHAQGVTNLVIFRGAVLIGEGRQGDVYSQTITSSVSFLKRAGGPTSSDDRRYMSWQQSNTDGGSYRTMVDIVPATFWVNIPSPAGTSLIGVTGVFFATSRRRSV